MKTYVWLIGFISLLVACAPVLETSVQNSRSTENPVYLWLEAENYSRSNWRGERSGAGPFAPADAQQASKLSGGKWLNLEGARSETYFLELDFEVEQAGDYEFYVRRFWNHGPFRYRVNDSAWVNIGTEEELIDEDGLRKHVVASWIYPGKVQLKQGQNMLRVELTAKEGAAAFDCFVFSKGVFIPRGVLKPGEKFGLAEKGAWSFEPDRDPFGESPIDLRFLNEKVAGESGPVRYDKAKGELVLGNGKPARFWSVTSYGWRFKSLEDLKYHTRRLAKAGVNMVRFHGDLYPKGENSDLMGVDETQREQLWRLVATAKQDGIYVTLSPYFVLTLNPVPKSWNIPGYSGWGQPFGVLFIDKRLQAGYKAWLKQTLEPKNPYTGIPLARDPALAVIQIQNEDSLFFWTIAGLRPEQKRAYGKLFGDWLKKKYGDLEKAKQAWGNATEGEDRWSEGIVSVYGAWEMTHHVNDHRNARLTDQIQFCAELMRSFNNEIIQHLRSMGFKGIINAGNWKTADNMTLMDVERYVYSGSDMATNHNYFNPTHVNPTDAGMAGYTIVEGDYFMPNSTLFQPWQMPTNMKQVRGITNVIGESVWCGPNPYQSEGPFLVSAYASLTGLDSFYWFAHGARDFDSSMGKFQVANPSIMGGFPAAALMFRKGYIRRGETVVSEHRALQDLWTKQIPLIYEEATFDPNRDLSRTESDAMGKELMPLAYLVGRCEVTYGSDPSRTKVSDLTRFVDLSKKTVRANTGEIELNYGEGICILNAPKAQGATGFLSKRSTILLSDVIITPKNEYATVLVVSMDEQPIKVSKKLLLQITTQHRTYGYRTEKAEFNANMHNKDAKPLSVNGEKILSLGRRPFNVVNTQMTIEINNKSLKKATLLDVNGYPVRDVPLKSTVRGFELTLPSEAMYLLLEG